MRLTLRPWPYCATGAGGRGRVRARAAAADSFLLGIIDVGRFMYVTNMAAKATQMGARYRGGHRHRARHS